MNAISVTKRKPGLVVVMGVSACGKSSVAEMIAQHFQFNFIEADNFHSEEAKSLMSSGQAIDDRLRDPWVQRLCQHLQTQFDQENSCVMAFSGLLKRHRDLVRELPFNTVFTHLIADQEIIRQRCTNRSNHFMPASLIQSQYQALESTSYEQDVIEIDAEQGLEIVLNEVKQAMRANLL
ncbi:MAG: AAA family ATPase [Acidiferrobacterales bacterium]|nr:AAA family ATPase [Acidiferrobacterales bacterium]